MISRFLNDLECSLRNVCYIAQYTYFSKLLRLRKSDVSDVTEHVWMDEHDVDFQSILVLALELDLH